jgi:hypothetical protein
MYTSCLFCHADLGVNPIFPELPVGRRIAFDSIRGRLWVICERCSRWNLTPLEDRWETLEQCERRFRATRLRFSTANIGLAYLKEGVVLVRIGPALKPEFVAWRYGRYLRQWAPPVFANPLGGTGRRLLEVADRSAAFVGKKLRIRREYELSTWLTVHYRPDRVVAVIPAAASDRTVVRARHLDHCVLLRPDPEEPWQLEVAHDGGTTRLSGTLGLHLAGKLLATLNGPGANDDVVRYAVAKLEDASNPSGYFARVAMIAMRCWWGKRPDALSSASTDIVATTEAERLALHLTKRSFWGRGGLGSEPRTSLPRLPMVDRLALEMAANEDAERMALEGELAALTEAWREAESIAAIADQLPRVEAPAAGVAVPDPACG